MEFAVRAVRLAGVNEGNLRGIDRRILFWPISIPPPEKAAPGQADAAKDPESVPPVYGLFLGHNQAHRLRRDRMAIVAGLDRTVAQGLALDDDVELARQDRRIGDDQHGINWDDDPILHDDLRVARTDGFAVDLQAVC